MPTENYNLPLIADNMANDIVRDMNALAEATDSALKGLGDGKANGTDLTTLNNKVTAHLDENKMSTIIKLNLNQSIPDNVPTPINFNNGWITNYNFASYAEIVNGKIRLVKGVYRIDLAFYYNSTSTPIGIRTLDIENIDRYFSIKANAMENSSQAVPLLGTLGLHVTGDFKDLDLMTYQTSGNPLNLLALSTVVIKKVGVL